MQTEITQAGPLLTPDGRLAQIGWMRQPWLDCNLEAARFYRLRAAQRLRVKRWDYYAIFTPQRFFSATISDLGYAGNIFVYTLDFASGELYEEGIVAPLGRGVSLPRNSQDGASLYSGKAARLSFQVEAAARCLSIDWPGFHAGRGVQAEIRLDCPPEHESLNIVIPIAGPPGQPEQARRFYYNRKINCLPASGWITYAGQREELRPETCSGSLDWGRGVWEYQSYWNWASASGILSEGRRLGLNLGCGFGDLSRAGENALILDGRIHKLEAVRFDYSSGEYMRPWTFSDAEDRLKLTFTPFKERLARINLGLVFSEVHQMFGRYHGAVVTDAGETIPVRDLVGFAEEHHARW